MGIGATSGPGWGLEAQDMPSEYQEERWEGA